MALSALELLDKVDPATTATRPEGAIDCILAEFGCPGWVSPNKALFVSTKGDALLAICPRRETHSALAATNLEAATVRARMFAAFRRLNPNRQRSADAPTVQQVIDARTKRPVGLQMSDGSPVTS